MFVLIAAAIGAMAASPRAAQAQFVDAGRFGRALKAGAAYAAAPHNPIYHVVPMTVELWAKVDSKDVATTLVFNEPRNSRSHWALYVEKGSGAFCSGWPGYDVKQVCGKGDIADGKWHYLAMTFDGETVRLWVDGAEAASARMKQVRPYPDTGPLLFGHGDGEAADGEAVLDEVRISRVIRSVEKQPSGPFEADADTVGLWHFDEDAAAYERSGLADASTVHNPARLKLRAHSEDSGGGFDATRSVDGKSRWSKMDVGAFFSSTLGLPGDSTNVTPKAISIRLGDDERHAVAFDTEGLRMAAGWTGEFVTIYPGREGLARHPDAGGKPVFSTRPGPGWAKPGTDDLSDPRRQTLGPLPADWAKYLGLFVHGDDVVLHYRVGKADVLERAGVERLGDLDCFTRTLEVGPSRQALTLLACDSPHSDGHDGGHGPAVVWLEKDGQAACVGVREPSGVRPWTRNGQALVTIPARDQTVRFKLLIHVGPLGDVKPFAGKIESAEPPAALRPLTRGGPARFPDSLITHGKPGKPGPRDDGAYVVDTLTAPDDNPWNSFLRFGGHDFFSNGDAAICSVSGDVWVVSGIDDTLANLKWRRYATGLFQPLGLKIVGDEVYVLGRDQITRLRDLNCDGEADAYENFNNDAKVTPGNGHAYVTCLETDPYGNFYYVKCGDETEHGGTVMRVSKDGSKLEVFATGVRNSNGLGASPDGWITEADNQGEWVPASRIDKVEQGEFLGYQPMSKRTPAPTDPGRPIVWMPQNVDNSSGGQTWVIGDKWGLPPGAMLHTSYGAAALLHVMTEAVDGATQGGVFRFPLYFASGVMRGRFRPKDGQLYVCGLRGWQTAGVRDGAFQRVRYTGKPLHMPLALHVHTNGVRLTFTCPLDKETAEDVDSYSILQWNYKWSSAYGSPHFSVKDPGRQGYDAVEINSATLLADGKTVFLQTPRLHPVMQMKISFSLDAADGTRMKQDVHNTIHALAPAFDPAAAAPSPAPGASPRGGGHE